MNKRKRKKWLKKRGLYVNPRDTWDLDTTIGNFMVPLLKEFKKLNNGYPGIEGMNTPEEWNEALDKMIEAFDIARKWDDLLDSDEYYDENYKIKDREKFMKDVDIRKQKIQTGLKLFATWYQFLWW